MADPEFRKTVLIGLGGAGQLIVLSLKRLFMDAFGVVPPSIKLLSLDTDGNEISVPSVTTGKRYTFDPHEFLHLEVKQPLDFIESGGEVGKWYVRSGLVSAISNGAGAVRQNGRLAFFFHINNIRSRLDRIVTALNNPQLPTKMKNAKSELGASTNFDLSRKAPEIYICGSLAGGTGSGTFLDAAILMRDQMPRAIIQGFFLLDWVYRHKAFARRVRGNVYAALSELDNLQSIMYGTPGFVPYSVRYADREVKVRDCPYSLVNLIDGRNQYGENIDSVNDLCDTVATAIYLSTGEMGQQVTSVVDNLLQHINVPQPRIWKGKHARYSSLGVSSIYYPAPELHRYVSMENALKLCREALVEAKGAQAGGTRISDRSETIDQDIDALMNHLSLTRSNVQNKVCPLNGEIAFQVEKYEIANAELLQDKQRDEEKGLEASLQKTFENHGKLFINNSIEVFEEKLNNLEKDSTKDTRYRLKWVNQASDRLQSWSDEASKEITEKLEEVTEQRKAAEDLLKIAKESRYIPLIGGSRKSAVSKWSEMILNLLKAVKKIKTIEYERRFYDALLEKLRLRKPSSVPGISEAERVLDETERKLRAAAAGADEAIKKLREKSTQVLLGNGNVVAIPGEGDRQHDESVMIDKIFVSYAKFKEEKGINTSEHYLKSYRENPENLFSLFSDYCLEKLRYLTDFSVKQAMETFGKRDVAAYTEEQIDHLFRLSSPLWSYHPGRVNEVQSLQYDNIIAVGVEHSADGREKLGAAISKMRDKHGVRADYAFSPTSDKYRIWLLNFAAALPLYFMNGLQETKERYEEEITPTYHIDKYLEMNAPDPFPVDEKENMALRVLGMAIVPGIDVVHDEYLKLKGGKGHKFTCEAEPVKVLNAGDPKVWYLFRDMYDDVKGDSKLREILIEELRKRVEPMPKEELKMKIKTYLEEVQKKLDARGFSRLISARLTYREVKELEQFLSPKGYAMKMEAYINGR